MPLDPRQVKALFNAAIDLPDPVDRLAFMDRECGYEPELRRRLDELLAAYDQPADVLENPLAQDLGRTTAPDAGPIPAGRPALTADLTAQGANQTSSYRSETPPPGSLVGSVIAGRYKLREEIGEGGMGSVYLAEQLQPVKRQVALKLIKAGMDTKTVLARFGTERQALAMMDHPNIAKVLDAGTTEAGRPFFVMELVKGVPLTDYCDQHRLGLLERLALFRQICSAVQHAHQKGIIHRDLKPSNILVESHDGTPVPKVIDFGLAKATSGLQLTEQSLYSGFGTVAGTPLYMAPEQASFNAIDVDTRADVYALGVILYELLTGSTPIERETFKKAAILEMLRMIREVEPPIPSNRISTADALPSLAASRQFEPSRLGRFMRGDLDCIVMKALAKERQRRYESPIAFSQDIERFLNHEPVLAGPPTAAYRIKKFVRRNRPQVLAASLVLLALVVGIIGTTLGLFEAMRHSAEANRQRRIAVAQTAEKEVARKAESAQRQQAEKRLSQIEKANEILGSIFKDLNPKVEKTEDKPLVARLGERLDQATAQIEGEAIGDPLTVARMQLTLGRSQLGLGYPEKAIALLAKARATFASHRAADPSDTISTMSNLAAGYLAAGKLDRALPLFEETRALARAALGPDHPESLRCQNDLAAAYNLTGKLDLALPLLEETFASRRSKLGPDHPDTLQSMSDLAAGYHGVGKRDRALPLLEETLALRKSKLGPDHPDTIASINNLAQVYWDDGRLDRSVALLEQALAVNKSKFGADHPDTFTIASNLAVAYQYVGKLDRAIPLYEELLARRKSKLGPDHPDTLMSISNLATGYQNAGKLERALPLYEEALKLRRLKLGPDHPDSLKSATILAGGYVANGSLDRALPLFEKTLVVQRAKLGANHPDTLKTMSFLAVALMKDGKIDRALPLLEKTLLLQKSALGNDHPDIIMSMNNLVNGYQLSGQLELGMALAEEAYALSKLTLGPDHQITLMGMNNLANGYQLGGKLDRALALWEETLALSRSKVGPDHPDTLKCMSNLGRGYQVAGRLDRATTLLHEATDLWKRKAGTSSVQYAGSLAALGLCLIQEKKWTLAEAAAREALTIQVGKEPDSPTTFSTKSLLGAALLGQKKFAEAEPLLKSGYEGMKQRSAKIPPQSRHRLGETLDRLIELAAETGKAEDAQKWKDEKAKVSRTSTPKPGPEKK